MDSAYTVSGTVSGKGRNGHGRSENGMLDLDLRIPEEMGGQGGGTNPEALFAVAYAGCFHSALKAMARPDKLDMSDSSVSASVSLVEAGPGHDLAVELTGHMPKLDRETAEQLMAKAHEICPYSKATRGNIEVNLSVE